MASLLLIQPRNPDLETDRVSTAIASANECDVVDVDETPITLPRRMTTLRALARRHPVVHAFGTTALAAAVLSGGRRILYSPVGFPRRAQVRWLRAAMRYAPVDVVCSSDTMRRFIVTRGVPFERTHLVRPGVQFKSIPVARNYKLRERLGLQPNNIALLAPLPVTRDSGHGVAMWASSLLAVLRPEYKLVLQGPLTPTIETTRSRLIDPSLMIVADEVAPEVPVEHLFSAADAVVLTPQRPVSPLVISMAMASARPIVSTTTAQICEWLEDRHTALLVGKPTPRMVAQRVLDLFDDPSLSWKIQDRARAEAYDHLTQARMLRELSAIYAGSAAGSHQSTTSATLANPSVS